MLKKKNGFDMYKNLVLITQIGLSVVTPIVLGVCLGMFLDKKFGTNMIWTMIFLIVGVLSGFLNIFKFGGTKKKKDEDDDQDENEID